MAARPAQRRCVCPRLPPTYCASTTINNAAAASDGQRAMRLGCGAQQAHVRVDERSPAAPHPTKKDTTSE
jgi:hypothetical protein